MRKCPTCERAVEPESIFRPFCSDRCKMVDLGRWMDGSYSIPSSSHFTERTEPMSEEIAAALAKRGASEDLIH